MNASDRLRSVILGALLLPLGCGGNTSEDPTGSGGSAGSGGTTSSGGTGGTGGTGGKPAVTCTYGTKVEDCFTPEQAWNIANNPPQGGDVVGNCPPAGLVQNSCCNTAQAGWEESGQCCYAFCEGACCGRPFSVDGVVRLAPAVPREDWLARFEPADERSGSIAEAWLRDARMEHASIASFARFTLELLAFGAPPELIADAQRAMADEIEHARLCFGLAERFGGRKLGPGPLETGAIEPRSLEAAAVAAFREGGVAETIAALAARQALERASDPAVRTALARIADDEERHAALAFRFLAFALDAGGAGVRLALEGALASLTVPVLDTADRALDVSAEVFQGAGRLSPAELQEAAHVAVREVIAPCARALLAGAAPRPEPVVHAPC
ncbi:MAG: ferritin-like domain-containing protein [Polyangiaceae bacterium]|nr:ferritin-like domain-containing protein [Polyangiaceae bacterium]MCL4749686.1 ferritin-like domain-containing protein [Myxococcales bacterium]